MIAKRIALVCMLFAFGLTSVVWADNGCKTAILSGAYGFSGTGIDVVRKSANALGVVPITFVGDISFSGDGLLSGSYTADANGRIKHSVPFTGAYVVNSDCTGSVAVLEKSRDESHFEMVILNNKREVRAMQTDRGTQRTSVLQKP